MPPPPKPLSAETRQLMSTVLDISLRQLAWPADFEWEVPSSEEPDPDDETARLQLMRSVSELVDQELRLSDLPNFH